MSTTKDSIFVQIASYRDPECQWTVKDLFEKASNPERISVGICWQFDPERDQACFQQKTRPNQVRSIDVHIQDSKGVCWARRQTQTLWDGEEYTLVIDSHMRFAPDWDTQIIKQLTECASDKPLISCNPASYTPPNKLESNPYPTIRRAHPFNKEGEMRCRGLILQKIPPHPLNGAFIAAGLMFSRSLVIEEVPYDPYLYFNQEEISYATRLYTHGWDVFSAKKMLFYHWYNNQKMSGRPLHWRDHDAWEKFQKHGLRRFNHLTGYQLQLTQRSSRSWIATVLVRNAASRLSETTAEWILRTKLFRKRDCTVCSSRIAKNTCHEFISLNLTLFRNRLIPTFYQSGKPTHPQNILPISASNEPAHPSEKITYRPLEPGEFVTFFTARDQNSRYREIHIYAGKRLAIYLLPTYRDTYLEEFFLQLSAHAKAFTAHQIQVLIILPVDVETLGTIRKNFNVPFDLWADPDQSIAASFGLEPELGVRITPYGFLLNQNLQIVANYRIGNIGNDLADMIRTSEHLMPEEEPRQVRPHAPVFHIPNVLDQRMCGNLIKFWENKGEHFEGKVGVGNRLRYSTRAKIRTDTHVTPEIQYELDWRLSRKLFPELEKLTGLHMTRRESYKIGCYDSERGGFFNQHRDNFETEISYRRYAMTLNLNNGFTGGELNFPEYGSGLYKPMPGTALVFPCSLMHRVVKVTTGRRFMLVSFFYGEKEAAARAGFRQLKGKPSTPDDDRIVLKPSNRLPEPPTNFQSRFDNQPHNCQGFARFQKKDFKIITAGLPPGLLVIEDYLDPAFCKYLSEHADRAVGRKLGVMDTERSSHDQTYSKQSSGRITDLVAIDGVADELIPVFIDAYCRRLAPAYGVKFEWFERPQILRYLPGGLYNKHADSEYWVKETDSWVRSLDRDYSILLYLNDEFTGGEIAFVDFDFKLKPKRGMLVAFPADHRYQHAALPVITGKRYVIVSWAAVLGTPKVKQHPPYAATFLNLPGTQ